MPANVRTMPAFHALPFTLAVVCLLAAPLVSTAQPATESLDTQRFRPHATSDGILTIEGAATRSAVDPFSMGLWFHYGHNPLVIANDDGIVTRIVGGQAAFDVTAAYAFAQWFELGLDLPFAALSGDGTDASTACAPSTCPTVDSEFGLGDLRLVPKFALMDPRVDSIGFAIVPELRLGTHSSDFLGGEGFISLFARAIIDQHLEASGLRWALQAGATLRESSRYVNIAAGNELNLGGALAYRFDQGFSPVELAVDLHSDIGLDETDAEEVSLEGLLALNVYLSPSWQLTGGAGLGLVPGYGTPTFRVLFGLRWQPAFNDPDGDGQGDESDLDPYKDPDKDNDGKVDDEYDKDGDGKVDEAYDEDGDGKLDDDVARKEQMEDYRDPDKDNDGKVDKAYDKDGDGKVDKEFDKDGDGRLDDEVAEKEAVANGVDLCPDLPEDFDGIEDEDGCPEGDEDGDGVLDLFDRCPDEAELINGFEDDDGCPDEGPAMVVVEEGKIKVLATIRFKTGSDELEDDSKPVMDQLVLTVRARQDIRRIRIEGHTDNTGARELNMALSAHRAQAVKQYMVERGIKSHRLEAVGYGPDKPIADNGTEDGRAQNRRVEFVIIQR